MISRPLNLVFGLIALMFWLTVYPHVANRAVPCWMWMCVSDIRVNSVTDGGTPGVIVAREIYRDFTADRVVRLVSLTGPDANLVCRRDREGREFTAGEPYPTQPIPLTQFQGVPPESACLMHNGSYQVSMTWTTRFWWLPGVAVTQTAISNIFQMGGITDEEH